MPIYEIGLSDLMRRNVEKGRLKFTSDLAAAAESSKVIFLAVGTPEGNNGEPDLSDLFEACDGLGEHIAEYKVIAIKSTVPVGTHKLVAEAIGKKAKSPFEVVSNPEFLREGSAVQDFLLPNRIILGVPSPRAEAVMREVYRGLYLIETPTVVTDNVTAELIKYTSNCFLAAKISLINEIARMCNRLGADVVTLAKAVGMDGRIGPKFLHPSPGFGGSCLVKDVAGLVSMAGKAGLDLEIPQAVQRVNAGQRELVMTKARALLGELKGKRVAVLGLSFKSSTDDVRNSPSLFVVGKLLEEGAVVSAYDPAAMTNFERHFPEICYAENPYEACRDADLIILMTEWNEFRELDLGTLKGRMRGDALLDPRNIYLPGKAREAGFRYAGFGRN